MTRFLVVTPVWNCVTYIQATLESVSAQTDPDWIHYLVDGGSTDGTLELLERSAVEDPRRRVMTGQDVSVFDALFKGFEQATVDGFADPEMICVWINGDDLLMPWAFAKLRQAFDETGAEWIMAIPTHWDALGRLALVGPYNCHPRWLISAGQINGRGLGWIQQESTFFTRGLLAKVTDSAIETIRSKKLSGDVLLWREFARYTGPTPLMTAVSGFRQHGFNLSTTQMDQYFAELRQAGVWIAPAWLSKIFHTFWKPFALVSSYRAYNRECNQFWNTLPSLSSRP